ncbi:MAG: UDP-N-acetylglucosamine 4,6-dehydratase family protein [Candidatus Hadarchaeales archaeon]
MEKLFRNRKVLITGAAGSVGRELVKEILKYRPEVVRLFDIDERRQFELRQELGEVENIRYLLGDIRDRARLRYAIEDIDIIFHTAALKHVEGCEYNPFEAVKTNVLGTQNVIDVAIEEEVSKVIFTSSDKAVNPTNVLGATKLLCEKLMTAANYYKGRRNIVFSSVRFGNVVGSSGSVVPLFKSQIQAGGPLTVTNPNMTRFIMSMSQAVKLLLKATEMARGGEVFVFKMSAVKISDLAQAMVEYLAPKFGHSPSSIKIKVIGSRPGEKMYEELMTDQEARRALETREMFIILPEMKELLRTKFEYPGARRAKVDRYRSCDVVALSRKEIEKMLAEVSLETGI